MKEAGFRWCRVKGEARRRGGGDEDGFPGGEEIGDDEVEVGQEVSAAGRSERGGRNGVLDDGFWSRCRASSCSRHVDLHAHALGECEAGFLVWKDFCCSG